jgi:sialate O-acetylesterase
MKMRIKVIGMVALSFLTVVPVKAEVKLPAIFGDHIVLQRGQSDPIWGWDAPGTEIAVAFEGHSISHGYILE